MYQNSSVQVISLGFTADSSIEEKKNDNFSQLPLNRHLVKVDTSLKRTRGVGPCRTSVIYFISLQGGHLFPSVSVLDGVDSFKLDIISRLLVGKHVVVEQP